MLTEIMLELIFMCVFQASPQQTQNIGPTSGQHWICWNNVRLTLLAQILETLGQRWTIVWYLLRSCKLNNQRHDIIEKGCFQMSIYIRELSTQILKQNTESVMTDKIVYTNKIFIWAYTNAKITLKILWFSICFLT